MTEQKEKVNKLSASENLNDGEIELRRYEARLSLWRTGIFGTIATILAAIAASAGTVITENIKSEREISLKGWEIEHNYVDNFVVNALDSDVEKQVRYARIFSILAPTGEVRERWESYLGFIMQDWFKSAAATDDLETRIRRAEYFSFMALDDSARDKWVEYKVELEKLLQLQTDKVKKLEKERDEVQKKADEDGRKLAVAGSRIEELSSQLSEKSTLAADKILELEREKADEQVALKVAQSSFAVKDTTLADISVQLQEAQSEIASPDQRVQQPIASKTGWVYLGEYDGDKGAWVTKHVSVGRGTNPLTLKAESLRVSASALNVRISGDPWGKLVDVLKQNAAFRVEEIDEWGSTGYFWARISYN